MYLRRQLNLKIASIFPGTLFPDAHPLKHKFFCLIMMNSYKAYLAYAVAATVSDSL